MELSRWGPNPYTKTTSTHGYTYANGDGRRSVPCNSYAVHGSGREPCPKLSAENRDNKEYGDYSMETATGTEGSGSAEQSQYNDF